MIKQLTIEFDDGRVYRVNLLEVDFMRPGYRIMLENTGELCPNLVYFEEVIGIVKTHHEVSRWENLMYS